MAMFVVGVQKVTKYLSFFLKMFFIFASHKNNYNHKEGISGPN